MLNVDRFAVKHGTQNIQNDCHQLLSNSFRVHQFRFRPGLRTEKAYSALPDSLSLSLSLSLCVCVCVCMNVCVRLTVCPSVSVISVEFLRNKFYIDASKTVARPVRC